MNPNRGQPLPRPTNLVKGFGRLIYGLLGSRCCVQTMPKETRMVSRISQGISQLAGLRQGALHQIRSLPRLPGTPFVVPLLDLLWILVRFTVRNPQKELQMGVQVSISMGFAAAFFADGGLMSPHIGLLCFTGWLALPFLSWLV